MVVKYQSAYLPHRSTETALTLIINEINDILIYLDNKAPRYLVLLYLSIDSTIVLLMKLVVYRY